MRKSNQARDIAISQGKKMYYTGVPCKYGHDSPRHVTNYACVACCRKYSEDWAKNNPDKILEAGRRAYKKDPSKAAARYAKRRATKKHATPKWVDSKKLNEIYLFARQKTQLTGTQWEVDHIVPLNGKNVCGLHVPWNLRVILASENRRKRNLLTP